MVMTGQSRSSRLRRPSRVSAAIDRRTGASDRTGRLIRMVLGIYLLPALLVVLVVGGVGILVVAVGKLVEGPIQSSVG